jgi:hypothetical protein
MKSYPTMKKHNPHTPILIREAQNAEPKVWARYDLGKEEMAPLSGMLLHHTRRPAANVIKDWTRRASREKSQNWFEQADVA